MSNPQDKLKEAWDKFSQYRIQFNDDPEALDSLQVVIQTSGIMVGIEQFEKFLRNRQRDEYLKVPDPIERAVFNKLSESAKLNWLNGWFKHHPIPGLHFSTDPDWKALTSHHKDLPLYSLDLFANDQGRIKQEVDALEKKYGKKNP